MFYMVACLFTEKISTVFDTLCSASHCKTDVKPALHPCAPYRSHLTPTHSCRCLSPVPPLYPIPHSTISLIPVSFIPHSPLSFSLPHPTCTYVLTEPVDSDSTDCSQVAAFQSTKKTPESAVLLSASAPTEALVQVPAGLCVLLI
jgi:hypothetical protein